MSEVKVGAGILNIITESLYDNPIVVFREYVQNSMDSIFKCETYYKECEIRIWNDESNLYFMDNGKGISSDIFEQEMIKIGASTKKRQKNLGYKGIGRLSGVPYCRELIFVNIYNYAKNQAQIYKINSEKYEQIKKTGDDSTLSFEELMNKIGKFEGNVDVKQYDYICSAIKKYDQMLITRNTGFLVVLKDISFILDNTIKDEVFFQNLQWLLPVNFDTNLYNSHIKELLEELTENSIEESVPVKYCPIYYNDKQIFRPINKDMLRDYVCKCDFKYAVGFHSFKGDKIIIDKNNTFSGIRIYIDNMLLCDENELLQNLENYGLLSHTSNGQLQSVRGIGAMIYITDKINISANARRTFIEVTDSDSLDFLKILAEFVNTIYDTRYALSNYISALNKYQLGTEKLQELREVALGNLRKLAKDKVELTTEENEEPQDFSNMSVLEKKKNLKRIISQQMNQKIREYIEQLCEYNLQSACEDFIQWLKN